MEAAIEREQTRRLHTVQQHKFYTIIYNLDLSLSKNIIPVWILKNTATEKEIEEHSTRFDFAGVEDEGRTQQQI